MKPFLFCFCIVSLLFANPSARLSAPPNILRNLEKQHYTTTDSSNSPTFTLYSVQALAGGTGVAAGGILAIALFNNDNPINFITLSAAYSLTTSLAVYATGSLQDRDGSFWVTFLGNFVGNTLTVYTLKDSWEILYFDKKNKSNIGSMVLIHGVSSVLTALTSYRFSESTFHFGGLGVSKNGPTLNLVSYSF